jgi:hypothetical protein
MSGRCERRPSTPESEVTVLMCLAGAAAYRAWEVDSIERDKSNAVANLVSRIYLAMDEERRLSLTELETQ